MGNHIEREGVILRTPAKGKKAVFPQKSSSIVGELVVPCPTNVG